HEDAANAGADQRDGATDDLEPELPQPVAGDTERLTDFPAVDDVRDTLDRLIQREPAYVVRIPRGAGQREDRYMHLLGGPIDITEVAQAAPARAASSRAGDLDERVEQLESEVAALKDELAALRSRLDAGDVV
ncbi:MAG TPA: hypothetical protein VLK83_11235, partial [Rhodanobacteraceae bacterium]|nr:hypothetical protein [Rhodanobacteraceae bacterium]